MRFLTAATIGSRSHGGQIDDEFSSWSDESRGVDKNFVYTEKRKMTCDESSTRMNLYVD